MASNPAGTKQNGMTYERECRSPLDRLRQENRGMQELEYFFYLAGRWFDREVRKSLAPKVVVLGPGIPEELLYGAGAKPHFVLGGSLRSTDWSDALVPRDTDPVSRSVLGFLNDPEGPDYTNSLMIVPASSDSMRKIAYLLTQDGRKVLLVDIPPKRDDPRSRIKWETQMLRMTQAVSQHLHKRVTARTLKRAAAQVEDARRSLREFLNLTYGREELLTGTARILVQNSYYYTDDLGQWTRNLDRLNQGLRSRRNTTQRTKRPGVLLMGSPVYFPNYKVPLLMEDIGLTILRNLDVTTLKLRIRPIPQKHGQGRETLIRRAADRWYQRDGSAAYAVNEAMDQAVCQYLRKERIEGVVYHVLKGQIEYDFELERLEKRFDACGIPVFRLETDYQYQDVEQLRIRMEAFSEMLLQNRDRKERMER